MDISETRLANLELLISRFDYKHDKDFCNEAGISPSYLSQLRGGQKKLGHLAREIEARLIAAGKDINRGWLDVPRGEQAGGRAAADVLAVAYTLEALEPDVRDSIKRMILAVSKAQIGMVPRSPADEAPPAAPPVTPAAPPPVIPSFKDKPKNAHRKSAPVQALQQPAKKRAR